jgi:hypothetical protein
MEPWELLRRSESDREAPKFKMLTQTELADGFRGVDTVRQTLTAE